METSRDTSTPSIGATATDAADLVAGIDIGSTGIKLLVLDATGAEVTVQQVPTPWRSGADGATELDAPALLNAIRELATATTESLRACGIRSPRLRALGIAGMGETGMLINANGDAVAPAFAWFDPRGTEQLAAFGDGIREEFSGRTGLPLGVQVSVAKLAYLRDHGVTLAGTRWLNIPEFIAHALGGRTAVERSLISRTGLLDQDSGAAWPAMLDHLGLTPDFVPDILPAGSDWGTADAALGTLFAGAQLTVAGHDHLVAAQASGTLANDSYHVSLGTAEVLLRVIDGPLGFAARQRLAAHLINEVAYVEPGKHVLVAGVKTGLLLRRALQTAGITDRAARNDLDAAVMALPYEGALPEGSIAVSGARNDDGMLSVTVRADGVNPAEIFAAILRHSNDEIRVLIDAMDRELPAATHATLTGGWASMASVRRARERVLPTLTVSDRGEDTAFGAALCASRLLDLTLSNPI